MSEYAREADQVMGSRLDLEKIWSVVGGPEAIFVPGRQVSGIVSYFQLEPLDFDPDKVKDMEPMKKKAATAAMLVAPFLCQPELLLEKRFWDKDGRFRISEFYAFTEARDELKQLDIVRTVTAGGVQWDWSLPARQLGGRKVSWTREQGLDRRHAGIYGEQGHYYATQSVVDVNAGARRELYADAVLKDIWTEFENVREKMRVLPKLRDELVLVAGPIDGGGDGGYVKLGGKHVVIIDKVKERVGLILRTGFSEDEAFEIDKVVRMFRESSFDGLAGGLYRDCLRVLFHEWGHAWYEQELRGVDEQVKAYVEEKRREVDDRFEERNDVEILAAFHEAGSQMVEMLFMQQMIGGSSGDVREYWQKRWVEKVRYMVLQKDEYGFGYRIGRKVLSQLAQRYEAGLGGLVEALRGLDVGKEVRRVFEQTPVGEYLELDPKLRSWV